MALLNCTRHARLARMHPASSCHVTRNVMIRSGSVSRSRICASSYSGCAMTNGITDSATSRTAWWNSGSPGLRLTRPAMK